MRGREKREGERGGGRAGKGERMRDWVRELCNV